VLQAAFAKNGTIDAPAGAPQKSELPVAPTAAAPAPIEAYRILFVGNSITQHGFNADTIANLHWDHVSGMAASDSTKDYVHLLLSMIQSAMPGRTISTRIMSLIPGGLGTTQERLAPVVSASAGFEPDLVIFQHGEHERPERGQEAVAETYNAVLDLFTKASKPERIVCVGNWALSFNADKTDYDGWSAGVEHTMRDICAKRGIPFVSVASIAADPACHGAGDIAGVQWHPSDAGHAGYARVVFDAVRPLLPSK
jgi:hypothetical protein